MLSPETQTGRRKHAKSSIVRKATLSRYTIDIDYRCSEAPTSQIPLVGGLLSDAVQSSRRWRWERNVGGRSTTDCLNALIPKNRSQDISITLLVGHEKGLELIEKFQLVPM